MRDSGQFHDRKSGAKALVRVGRGIAGMLRSSLIAPLPAHNARGLYGRFVPRPDELAAWTARYPILATDDDFGMVSLNKMVIDLMGLSCIATTSVRTALHLAHVLPISLIVSDIMKPDIDGFEMLRLLRDDPVTWPIPVFFATARGTIDAQQMALASGAQGFLAKPYAIHDLQHLVTSTLLAYGNWRMPTTLDASLYATLTKPEREVFDMPGWGRVLTTLHRTEDTQSSGRRPV